MRNVVVLAILALVVAGCSSPKDDSTPDVSGTSSTGPVASTAPAGNLSVAPAPMLPPGLSLADCNNRGGTFAAPMAASQALLPDGFEPVAFTSRTGQSGALLYAIAVDCASYAINGTPGGRVQFAYAELAVTPSPAYAVPDIDDCTVPIAFIVAEATVGALAQTYRLGLAGAGTKDETAISPTEQGAFMQSFNLGDTALQFIFGDVAPDTLSVGTGDFIVYGVQDKQVQSILQGTAGGNAAANYASAMFQTDGMPDFAFQSADLGFAATGFSLAFQPLPLPASA